MGLQIGISFIARIAIPFVVGGAGMGVFVAIIIALAIPVASALSFGGHCKLDMTGMTEKEEKKKKVGAIEGMMLLQVAASFWSDKPWAETR